MMLVGIDPGREKFGWAWVDRNGGLVLSGITPRDSFGDWLEAAGRAERAGIEQWVMERNLNEGCLPPVSILLLGEGTGMKGMAAMIEGKGVPFKTVPEAYSTLRARSLYWLLHPPRGLARFVPLSFRVPPRPVDDLAAWRLVLDYLSVAGAGSRD